MTDSNHYILQGGPENLHYWLANDIYKNTQWFWSANKHIRKGDTAFIYLTTPLSRIVGKVDVIGEPFYHDRQSKIFINRHMQDRWCVEVGNPCYFGLRDDLTVKNLRSLFSIDWGWVRYPRGNTRVPAEILPTLVELISTKDTPVDY